MNTKGKVGKIRVKISNIGIYLFLFLSYHVSSLGFLGINSGLQILIALLIVVLISFRHYSHLKRTKAIPALWFVVFAISLRNNWYLQEAKISYVFYFCGNYGTLYITTYRSMDSCF